MCAHGNLLIHPLAEPLFHHVQVLYAENIAGTHYRTGVVQLVNIFRGHGEMAGTLGQNLLKELLSALGEVGL